jgi:hypothetical protein
LRILGRNFGESREAAGGQVFIAGATVRDYESWSPTEIRVVVPPVAGGPERSLDVEVFGQTARHTLRVSC